MDHWFLFVSGKAILVGTLFEIRGQCLSGGHFAGPPLGDEVFGRRGFSLTLGLQYGSD